MTGKEKRRARQQAQNAVDLGPCKKCGAQATDRHHPDYTKPLEVILLCRECHMKEHVDFLKEEGARGAKKRWAANSKEAVCEYCEKLFTRKRPREKTCSRSCGNKLAWMRRRGS